MNGYTQEEGASSPNEQLGYYAPPRRFVFDVYVPNNTSVMDSESYEPSKQGKNAGLQKFLPIIQEFIPPKDYKAAYEDVCEHILGAYTEIRELILTEAVEDMQEALKGTKIEGPNDCVKLLRELSGRLCGRRENTGKQKVQKAVGKYEKLVQDSELKVRELIRNEQIYRLNFDQLVLKNEESDRIIAEMKEKLAEDRALIEGLTKEASKLTAILRKKDEEIRNLRLECQAAQNQIEIPSPSESPVSADRHKGKTLSCTSNNLRMLLNDNRLTPTDFSSKITTVRKSSNRTPTSGKMKYVPKPGTLLDLTSMSSKALKINGLDKIKDTKETLRSQVGVQTERRKNGSGTPGINPSSRGVEGFNFFSSARGSSTQQISGSHTPDQANMKQALRIKARKDGYGHEEKSYSPLPMRAKHHEDFVSGPMKTDSFEEYPKSSVVLEKADRKRGEDYERKPSIRMEQGQNAEDKTRRRSGATRSRPMAGDMTGNSQKSLEHKNSLSSQRQTHKMTKSKSIVFENKSVKGGKNSSNPLVNIMMKKFTEQEFNSKKGFNG